MGTAAKILVTSGVLLFAASKIAHELNPHSETAEPVRPTPARLAPAVIVPAPPPPSVAAPIPPDPPRPAPSAPIPIPKQVADAIASERYEFALNLLLPDRVAEVKAALRRDPNVQGLKMKGDQATKDGHADDALVIYRLSRTLTDTPSAAMLGQLERRSFAANTAARLGDEKRAATETWANELDRLQRGTESHEGLRISVDGVKLRRSMSSGLTSYTHDATGRFIVLDVVVTNVSQEVKHVNPLYFTLSTCSEDKNADELTWGLPGHLKATNVMPGSHVRGKLMFETDTRCDDNTLNFIARSDRAFLALPAITAVR